MLCYDHFPINKFFSTVIGPHLHFVHGAAAFHLLLFRHLNQSEWAATVATVTQRNSVKIYYQKIIP
jgi:hypothetical protein